jgi:hypothetical protein
MNVAKIDHDVVYIAMVVHVCYYKETISNVSSVFQMYVGSVFIWMLHMFSHICCKCFIWMLCIFAMVFKCFCKCFIRIFQMFHLSFFLSQVLHPNVSKIDRHMDMHGKLNRARAVPGGTRHGRHSAARAPCGRETQARASNIRLLWTHT